MQIVHILCALTMVLIWGMNFVASKIGLQTIPPLLFAAERFFLASIPLVFFLRRPPIPLNKLLRYGLMSFAIPFGLLLWGMFAGVSAGIASLVMQAQGLFSVLFGIIFFGEKPHIWQIIGMGLALIGLSVIGIHIEGSYTWTGFFLVIAGAAALASGNVISKRAGKVNMLSLVAWGSLFAWPPLLIGSFIIEGPERILASLYAISLTSLSATAYISYFATTIGFGIWGMLLHHYPLSTVASFTLLVPVIGFISSALVLGETLQLWKILALIFVGSGLAVNIIGSRYRAKKQRNNPS